MKRVLEGIVVSDKMQQTAVVAVSYKRKHEKYHKYFTVTRRFKAHNENNEFKTGQVVYIEETRPMSKDKRWKITGLVPGAVQPIQTENEALRTEEKEEAVKEANKI